MQDPKTESGSEIIWKVGPGSKSFRIHNTDGNNNVSATFWCSSGSDFLCWRGSWTRSWVLTKSNFEFQEYGTVLHKSKAERLFYHSLVALKPFLSFPMIYGNYCIYWYVINNKKVKLEGIIEIFMQKAESDPRPGFGLLGPGFRSHRTRSHNTGLRDLSSPSFF